MVSHVHSGLSGFRYSDGVTGYGNLLLVAQAFAFYARSAHTIPKSTPPSLVSEPLPAPFVLKLDEQSGF